MDMSQMVFDSIPQIQAQIAQISVMLQNPSLPLQVRHTTEMQYQQLQMQLQQAQTVAVVFTAASSFQQQQEAQAQNAGVGLSLGLQNFPGGDYRNWTNSFPNQQPAASDSAYQRLPLNNRRRNLKRERPSDFLDVSGEHEKVARYWE
jgi:protein MPE1